MIEIFQSHNGVSLWVGDEVGYLSLDLVLEDNKKDTWGIIHTCKELFLEDGDISESLFATRDDELILNLVGMDDREFVTAATMKITLDFINRQFEQNNTVFIHCDKGDSRAAFIGFLFLYYNTTTYSETTKVYVPNGIYSYFQQVQDRSRMTTIKEALKDFKTNIYPGYKPSKEMRDAILKSEEFLFLE